MARADEILAAAGVTPTFDEDSGQQYAEWTDAEGRLCQIWLEDDASVAERAKLVSEYELGGIAEWVLGNQKDSVWAAIQSGIG